MRRIQWARSRNLPINVGPCASLQYYTVQNGEYWGILARRFNLTQTELQAANPQALREEGVLRPGDRLLVPTGVAIKLGGQGDFYTVQTGDSWAEIARRLNMPLRLLQTVNPQVVRPYYLLKPGDQIFIPNAQQLAAILQ